MRLSSAVYLLAACRMRLLGVPPRSESFPAVRICEVPIQLESLVNRLLSELVNRRGKDALELRLSPIILDGDVHPISTAGRQEDE
jgi:hypothetical protein